MANVLYTKFLEVAFKNDLDWETATIRVLLERDTSTYAVNKDHDFVSDLTGLVEISVASYARQTLAGGSVVLDDANDRIELDCSDLAFGNLESGQTVESLIFYQQIGGSDATPADDVLICRIDTDAAPVLPAALAGGAFNVTINTEGLIQVFQP